MGLKAHETRHESLDFPHANSTPEDYPLPLKYNKMHFLNKIPFQLTTRLIRAHEKLSINAFRIYTAANIV